MVNLDSNVVKYKYIIFDFDGVLIESNEIRFEGFRLLFKDYPKPEVEKLIRFAKLNSGLSRYDKIRYFYEEIRDELMSADNIELLSKQYTGLVKQKIIEANPVKGSLEFLSAYYGKCEMAIVSACEQDELIEVCQARKIQHFFTYLLGSPVSKELNIVNLFQVSGWNKNNSVLVGDSHNDLDVAKSCKIDFIARNSDLVDWNSIKDIIVIEDISQLALHLI